MIYTGINMNTPTYNAQCKTWKIAQQLTNNFSDVSQYERNYKPPFCLRVIKTYRTQAMQDFRNAVALVAKQSRNK